MSDKGNERIVRVNLTDSTAISFAGALLEAGFINGVGNTARFSCPAGICADDDGNLFIADADNHLV